MLTVYFRDQNFKKSAENTCISFNDTECNMPYFDKRFGGLLPRFLCSAPPFFFNHLTSPSLKLEIPITPFLLERKFYENG